MDRRDASCVERSNLALNRWILPATTCQMMDGTDCAKNSSVINT
jgi:hypothetical protein